MGLYTLVKGRKRRWEVIFPFGFILHTHFHHCRQCREKNPLHDAPKKNIKRYYFLSKEMQYMKRLEGEERMRNRIQQCRTQKI